MEAEKQGGLTPDEQQRVADVLGELNRRGLTTVKDGKIQPKKAKKDIKSTEASFLLTADLPPILFLVEGLMSQGLGGLSAKSKLGKSWLGTG